MFIVFSFYLSQHVILHLITYTGTPKQNVILKRKFAICQKLLILQYPLCMFQYIPYESYALSDSWFSVSSLSLLSGPALGSFLSLKVFECICYVYVPKSDHSKLDPKALKFIFLRYAPNQKDINATILLENVLFPWMSPFMSLRFFFSQPPSSSRGEMI